MALIGLGFLLGVRHATDPDHVIAITTSVSRERNVKQAALIGVAWGAGHTASILVVGSAMVLLRVVFPPRVGLAMELAVAAMLVLLGLRNMGPLFGVAVEASAGEGPRIPAVAYHSHGDYVHAHQVAREHAHPHDPDETPLRRFDRWFARRHAYQILRPVLVGTVHGLAGSAAIALLVLSTLESMRWAVAYLLMFGIGTILGMTIITVTLASAFSFGQTRFQHIGRHFGLATGVVSVAFGLFIAYQVGFVHGLFTGQVLWTPQ
jgi:high-affinity nickel-transport protein